MAKKYTIPSRKPQEKRLEKQICQFEWQLLAVVVV